MSSTSSGSSNLPASPSGSLSSSGRFLRGAGVIVVSSVMFTFIGYWRTAAVVLCDLASTAYYIGAIVEQSIGPAAPWFILGVMCFSYAVRWVYIESCTLFVRGGVYRVVREAMGGWMAKLAVSALMFDYILTGPISSVSAGHYILGLGIDLLNILFHAGIDPAASLTKTIKNWGAVGLACSVVIYFFYQNLRGIHESSDKALKIMIVTTIMGVIMIGWSLITLAVKGPTNPIPSPEPHLIPRINHTVDPPESIDPTGFIQHTPLAEQLRGQPKLDEAGKPVLDRDGNPHYDIAAKFNWFSMIGLLGVFIAFGHSILAMSGEETLAQVYREVESPKLANFKKAALIVFIYSICLTGTISFLAVIMIPDEVRLTEYAGNLLGGLAMQVWAPPWAKLALQAFVVIVGFLILSGAVNTAIIGSNGVLNRVAEDGVMPDWFLKPHPRFGTTYRLLCLIACLQIFTIIASQGDVFLLGEAYAFGVVWSFVFQALSMMVLRFKRPEARDFKVPFNIPFRGYEIPVGLGIILVILLMSAIMNFLTKELATIGGMVFTLMFFTMFTVSEKIHAHRLKGKKHEHIEQFNRQTTDLVTGESLGLTHPYRMLVSIRSTMNLFMLEKALSETDPETTSVVVMTAKYIPPGSDGGPANLDMPALDNYDQQLMTAVVDKAEKAGKEVVPLIVPTNNPLHAILKLARDIQANELILGASNKFTADQQMEQIAFYWINLHGGQPSPLTVRILSRERDMFLDLGGGSRIPKIGERRARTADELREAGVGVDRVLLIHDGSHANSDLFSGFLTMLDEKVVLGVVPLPAAEAGPGNEKGQIERDLEFARRIGRVPQVHELSGDIGEAIVDLARKERYDLIVLPLPAESPSNPLGHLSSMGEHVVKHAHCRLLLATTPVIPDEVIDTTPSIVSPTG